MRERQECQVCIVDDDPSLRRALSRILRTHGFAVRTFSSAREFLDQDIPRKTVGCILLDINMPGMNGLDMQSELVDRGVQLPVVFITANATVPASVKALKKGALDFVEKPFDSNALMAIVDNAIDISRRRIEESIEYSALKERMASLTPRELQVFEHVVSGMLNREIALRLGIVEKTVKVHRARLMAKLEAKSVVDLVRLSERLRQRRPA